ncbi:hypothetical protein HK102_002384 [Quaeritorhiza haematococci]|nr:hypothetical protein HK102_002384 [Quaeritorhiza haematococci]
MTFNANKTKVQLKLAVNRLKLLQQKKATINQSARKEIASLLEKGKEESARIRVEHVIREDFNIEAMEILELYCELLLARFGLLEQMRHCDQAIAEAVNTIIYAAPRSEIKELYEVRDQLIMKFGKEFAMAAMENKNDIVNSRIVHKLKVQTPDPILVNQYLKTIAKAYNVIWDFESDDDALYGIDNPTGGIAADTTLGIGGIGMKDSSMQPTSAAQIPITQVPYTYPKQYPQQPPQQQQYQQLPLPPQQQPPPLAQNYPQGLPQSYTNKAGGAGGGHTAGLPPTSFGLSSSPQRQQQPYGSGPSRGRQDTSRTDNSAVPDFPIIPGSGGGGTSDEYKSDDLPDFDDLTRRFEALKRKK